MHDTELLTVEQLDYEVTTQQVPQAEQEGNTQGALRKMHPVRLLAQADRDLPEKDRSSHCLDLVDTGGQPASQLEHPHCRLQLDERVPPPDQQWRLKRNHSLFRAIVLQPCDYQHARQPLEFQPVHIEWHGWDQRWHLKVPSWSSHPVDQKLQGPSQSQQTAVWKEPR